MTGGIPGTAGRIVAELGARAVVSDLYDSVGAHVYHDVAGSDQLEIRELITAIRPLPGRVLELAAGSGRITMPLLAAGREVVALELSPSMLALLTERLASAPAAMRGRCTTVCGDMRDFSFDEPFGVIVLGTTSISLLDADGRARRFSSVRAHLTPGGRFFVSTVDVDRDYDGPPELELPVRTPSGREYRMFEFVDADAGYRTVTIFPSTFDPTEAGEGTVNVCTTRIAMLSPEALTAELAAAGLQVRVRHPLPNMAARLRGVLLEAEVAQ